MLMPSLPVATNGLVDTEGSHSRSCRHVCLSKYPLYRVGWAHRIPLDLMRPLSRWLMMPGAIRNQQCRMPPWLVSRWHLSSCCPWVKLELRHMLGSWQQCWLATPASMVGNRFVLLAILLRLRTSFHWDILA